MKDGNLLFYLLNFQFLAQFESNYVIMKVNMKVIMKIIMLKGIMFYIQVKDRRGFEKYKTKLYDL